MRMLGTSGGDQCEKGGETTGAGEQRSPPMTLDNLFPHHVKPPLDISRSPPMSLYVHIEPAHIHRRLLVEQVILPSLPVQVYNPETRYLTFTSESLGEVSEHTDVQTPWGKH